MEQETGGMYSADTLYCEDDVFYTPSICELPEQTEEKSKLKKIQDRILKEGKDEFCKLVEEKEKEIQNKNEELEDINAEIEEEKALKEALEQCFENLKKRICGEDDLDKRNLDRKNADERNQKEMNMIQKLGKLGMEMSSLKALVDKLKKKNQLLQDLRKNPRQLQIIEVPDDQNKCIEGIKDKRLINYIRFQKEQLLKDIDDREKERDRLIERKSELMRGIKDCKKEIEKIEKFLKENINADELLAIDRNEFKKIEKDLICKEVDLDSLKYKVDEAEMKVNDMKKTVEDKQTLVNDYKRKCSQIHELLIEQAKSFDAMEPQFQRVMDSINKEFLDYKVKKSAELRSLFPVLSDLRTAQNKLKKSKRTLCVVRSAYKNLKEESQDLETQAEQLVEEIHFIKKAQLNEEQDRALDKKIFLLETDTETQYKNYYNLKETIQQLKLNIKKANITLQEKQKECVKLRALERDFREKLTDLYQHEVGQCKDGTEAYLQRRIDDIRAELESMDISKACAEEESNMRVEACQMIGTERCYSSDSMHNFLPHYCGTNCPEISKC